ncbi:hypothetical protein ACTQ49_01145 [Luteococcus sp. Sow4_B9]|uniref:hypothetical protein n=1 Tax=Luteococcus sp. Sow4_B9 TaxID=3438792 RepID=UPI003F997672
MDDESPCEQWASTDQRSIPLLPASLAALAVCWLPLHALVLNLTRSDAAIGFGILAPSLLGLLAAALVLGDRRRPSSNRLGWATTCLLIGLASAPLWIGLATAVLGP